MEQKLSNELLEQMANLSKIELTGTDKQELQKSLEQMLHYVDKLRDLSTDDSLPLTHFPEITGQLDSNHSVPSLREDVPRHTPHPEQLTALAPKQSDSYYVVPNSLINENTSAR